MIQLTAAIDIKAESATGCKVRILAYGGGVMSPQGHGELVIDLKGLELPDQVPLLAEHNDSLDGIIGKGKPKIEAGKLYVDGQLIDGEKANKIRALSQSGIPLQASVGVEPTRKRLVKDGETVLVNGQTIKASRPLTLVEAGKLREISIVSLGADSTTSAIVAKKGTQMSEVITADNNHDLIRAERERIAQINRMTTGDWGSQDAVIARLRDQAINEEISLSVLANSLLECIRAQRPKGPAIHASHHDNMNEKTLEASLMIRAGQESLAVKAYGEQTVEAARKAGIHSLVDLCKASLLANYKDVPSSRDEMIRASVSNSNLPNILSNTLGRSLIESYTSATQGWRPFARVLSAANFQPQTAIRPSTFEPLEQVAPGGNLTHASLNEDGVYSWRVDTFGRMLTIDRRDIVNDNLQAFSEVGPMMGMAAGRSLNDLVWKTILGAGTHYSVGNKNLISGGTSALSITSLGNLIAKMRQQVDRNGMNIDLQLSALVVPVELEATARAILASAEIKGSTNEPSGNPMFGIVPNLVVEPRLSNSVFTGNSATAWYLFAQPIHAPILVGFLQGRESPTIETADADFATLGMQMRIYHDYGCALGDAKASAKSAGA
jgi:hypothetical protein